MSDLPDWSGARRILCVRLDNMGDVLMTTPAMQALAESAPDRHIALLTSTPSALLAPHLPMVDEVIPWNAPWVRHDPAPSAADVAHLLPACARALAARGFDAAVIFTVYSQSALPAAMLCCLAGIPLRLAHCRENPYALLSDWVAETEPDTAGQRPRHEVRRQLDLVARVGAVIADTRMRFHVREADRQRLDDLLSHRQPPRSSGRGIVVHPGATAASRRWPSWRFAEVARELAMRTGGCVWITGSGSEAALAEAVCADAMHPHVRTLAGKLSLGEMAALLERSDLLVSNNSGPVHLAAALGTPTVDLYALTNPQHTPWQVPHRTLYADVPCRYCYKSTCPAGHHRCLRDVTVADTVGAAMSLLDGEVPPPQELPWGAATRTVPLHPVAAPRPTLPMEEDPHVHTWH